MERGGVARGRTLAEGLPPYRVDDHGALAEWAWPGLETADDHRHVSHLYPVWPLHDITPDDTPDLAVAAPPPPPPRGGENPPPPRSPPRAPCAPRPVGVAGAGDRRRPPARQPPLPGMAAARHHPGRHPRPGRGGPRRPAAARRREPLRARQPASRPVRRAAEGR